MDVDAILEAATLPEVLVDSDIALDRSFRSADLRQRRRKAVRTTVVGVVVLLVLAIALFVASGRSLTDLPLRDMSAPASWDLDMDALPTVESTSVNVLVTQIACNDGKTNTPREPNVDFRPDEIIITIDVEASDPGFHTCPGSMGRPLAIDFGGPIGNRALVDGRCRSGSELPVNECEPGAGVRWAPTGREGVQVTGTIDHYDGPGVLSPVTANVQALDASGQVAATATTNEEGRFALNLPNGTYQLSVEPAPRPDGTSTQCGEPQQINVIGMPIDFVKFSCVF